MKFETGLLSTIDKTFTCIVYCPKTVNCIKINRKNKICLIRFLSRCYFRSDYTMAANVWGFVQWPIRDPGSRAAKSRSWVKVLFLDQISKRPCQSDMSLGFILTMRIYSDGHCTKPNVGCCLLESTPIKN